MSSRAFHVFIGVAVATLLATVARAGAEPAAGSHGGVPDSVLQRPVPLRRGIGNSHEPVTTRSSEAQAYYDQGLNYLESYVWVEASRSFHQALRIDPDLAMAHVGLSRAYSGLEDSTEAKQELERARKIQRTASPRERRRIGIRARQLEAMGDPKNGKKLAAYRKALDEALREAPDDIELLLLRGNASESSAAGRGQLGTEASLPYYRHVLRLVPDDASANHFLVHTFEALDLPDSALAHGEAYARLAPAVPHAAHMLGHALRHAGRIREAIAQFQRADALERAYYRSDSIDPRDDWHHSHNINLLATAYRGEGRRSIPLRLRPAAGSRLFALLLARGRSETPGDWIRQGRYFDALRLARFMERDVDPALRVTGHVRAAQALHRLHEFEKSRRELDDARREAIRIPAATGSAVTRSEALEEAIQDAAGGVATRGDAARALTLFELDWIGRRSRSFGDWDAAEAASSAMVQVDAAFPRSHLAEAAVLEHAGHDSGAAREREIASRLGRRDPETSDAPVPGLAARSAPGRSGA